MWWYLKRIVTAWKPCRCAVMAPKKRRSPGPEGVGFAKIISEVEPACSSCCCCCWWWTSLSPWSSWSFNLRGRELVEAPNRCPLGGKSPMQLGPEGRMYIIRRGWEMGKFKVRLDWTFQLLHSRGVCCKCYTSQWRKVVKPFGYESNLPLKRNTKPEMHRENWWTHVFGWTKPMLHMLQKRSRIRVSMLPITYTNSACFSSQGIHYANAAVDARWEAHHLAVFQMP